METTSNEGEGLAKRGETTVAKYDADDVDYEQHDYAPQPLRRFARIRQKPLVDETTGQPIRNAGGFVIDDPADPDAQDVDSLLVAVLNVSKSRAMWQEGSRDPVCKSVDMIRGSHEREGDDMYGDCGTCRFSMFIDGEKPKCRASLDLLCLDINTNLPIILSFTYSGEKEWRGVWEHMRRKADDDRVYPKRDGKAPTILHLFAIPVSTRYMKRGAWEYFVPVFGTEMELPDKIKVITREMRRTLKGMVAEAVGARKEEAF